MKWSRVLLASVLLLVGSVSLFWWRSESPRQAAQQRPEPLTGSCAAPCSRTFPLSDLEEQEKSLAEPGHYNLIEVFSKDCRGCAMLEARLNELQSLRSDVFVLRLELPMPSDELSSQQVRQLWQKTRASGVCSLPHLRIFGPDGQAIAKDTCQLGGGYDFFFNWLIQERAIAAFLNSHPRQG